MPPPDPVKISHKKMAAKGSRINFMFLPPPPAVGSATVYICVSTILANNMTNKSVRLVSATCRDGLVGLLIKLDQKMPLILT